MQNAASSEPIELAQDRDGNFVFLARGSWELDYAAKTCEDIRFLRTKKLQ